VTNIYLSVFIWLLALVNVDYRFVREAWAKELFWSVLTGLDRFGNLALLIKGVLMVFPGIWTSNPGTCSQNLREVKKGCFVGEGGSTLTGQNLTLCTAVVGPGGNLGGCFIGGDRGCIRRGKRGFWPIWADLGEFGLFGVKYRCFGSNRVKFHVFWCQINGWLLTGLFFHGF